MSRKKGADGFTLLEITIVLVMSSIVLLTLLRAFTFYTETMAEKRTEDSLEVLRAGIYRFYNTYNRYPCPAPLGVGPEHATYGREQCETGNIDGTSHLPNLNQNAHISNPVDADGDSTTPNDLVLIGAIPYKTIEPCLENDAIDCSKYPVLDENTYDGWGNKFTYAVTQALAEPIPTTPFSVNGGVISVEDENKIPVVDPPDSAHFVIVSHGQNRRGAFNKEGEQIQDDCVGNIDVGTGTLIPFASDSGRNDEKDNCNHIDGLFVSALKNDNYQDETRYFDDDVYFFKLEMSQLFRRTGLSEMVNNNEGNVGIGKFDPTTVPTADLHIRGDMQSLDFYSDRLCDETGANCFLPEFLGGPADTSYGGNGATDPADFQNTCANSSEAIVKISENHVTCSPVYTNTLTAQSCNTAADLLDPASFKVLVGYSNTGQIICRNLF